MPTEGANRAPTTDPALKARYRRIMRFAARALAQAWWFELVLPRFGLDFAFLARLFAPRRPLRVDRDVVKPTAATQSCDLVLLDGQCLVDESLLTGESVPMLKTSLVSNDEIFSEKDKEHVLFAGTYCLTSVSSATTDNPAVAMVYQIGFGTTKGRLIRSIMFNDPALYRFERDSNFFILCLFGVGVVFMAVYYYITFREYGEEDANIG